MSEALRVIPTDTFSARADGSEFAARRSTATPSAEA